MRPAVEKIEKIIDKKMLNPTPKNGGIWWGTIEQGRADMTLNDAVNTVASSLSGVSA